VDELLKDTSIEEILETLNKGEKDLGRAEEEAFNRWYQWYKVANAGYSRNVEAASYGMLLSTVVYMAYIMRKRVR
jgi:hypothetical protein